MGHPVRHQILAATLTGEQRRVLRGLPAFDIFNCAAGSEAPPTLRALRRERLIERIPHDPAPSQIARHRLTALGRLVQAAAEGMR